MKQEEDNIIPAPGLKVLAVDDEEFNLEILCKQLNRAGYQTEHAHNGREAWDYLQNNPSEIDIMLLDKMMPEMNGLELMARLKSSPLHRDIPVIMQTASVGSDAIIEGLEAGVYYYLTKPFEHRLLISIVNAAARDLQQRRKLRVEAEKSKRSLGLMTHYACHLRTHEEATNVAAFLAHCFPTPERMGIVLSELLLNAIEHGNLGIGYQRKTELVAEGELEEEIARRQELPENMDKCVAVEFERTRREMIITIMDQGKGFDYEQFLDFDPLRALDPNGRGIAMANALLKSQAETGEPIEPTPVEEGHSDSLGSLYYLDGGSRVMVKVRV